MGSEIWESLRQWQQAIGAGVGFLALAVAALFNAHLNRRRDDRLQHEERRIVARSLLSEIVAMRVTLETGDADIKTVPSGNLPALVIKVTTMTLPREIVFPALVSKLGLLDSVTAQTVINFYSSFAGAKQVISEYDFELIERMHQQGGERAAAVFENSFNLITRIVEMAKEAERELSSFADRMN